LATEEQLAIRAVKGDEQAFLQLMGMYKMDLYKTALAYMKNKEEAIEAIQEITYRAYKNVKKVKEPTYFKTWLIRIMINYCNDQLKMKSRVVLNEEMIHLQGVTDSLDALEMEEALESLDSRSREIITMKYFNGLKIKEIAAVLECPEGTVKTWLYKALESLRNKLDEKGGK
jgi:RNA polymerase sigma factor (sigma-70 family)